MGRSIALVSSRGGVGKSTLASQLAASYASNHRDITVILIDASLHGDSSAHLLGGMQEPSAAYPDAKSMAEGVITALPAGKSFYGLLQALNGPAPQPTSSFGRLWSRAPAPASQRVNLLEYAAQASETWPSGCAPTNLHVIPGGKNLKSLDPSTAPALATTLSEVIRAAPSNYLVVFDTDAELIERTASTIAAVAADRIAIVASSQWQDFLRIITDPHNSIIDFLNGVASSGRDIRKISHFVFTNLPKTRNDPSTIHGAPVLPFKPNKQSTENVEQIVSYIYERSSEGPFEPLIVLPNQTRLDEFANARVSGMLVFPEGVIQIATLKAQPIATMPASGSTAEALAVCKEALTFASDRVLNI